MTADVTRLRPPLEHFASCDREVYGAAAMLLLEGPAVEFTAANLRRLAAADRAEVSCECLRIKVLSLESALATALKRWEASTTDDNAERVACLKAALARLRSMQ